MKKWIGLGLLLSQLAVASDSEMPAKRYSLWVEGGAVWQTVNDVQIPADTGTRFSVVDFGAGPKAAGRVYLGYRMSERGELRLLLAPLSLSFEGNPAAPISYQGQVFAARVATEAFYRFNSYRLSYRYRFHESQTLSLRVGFTAKVRDAEIRLTQGSLSATKKNVGFVPLAHFSADWSLGSGFVFIGDVDALAAPQGRAEDVALQMGYDLNPSTQLRLGYRTVEGGSTGGGGVYTFAWLHFATAGLFVQF